MVSPKVSLARDATSASVLLDSREIAAFIARLAETRWTGRAGYPLDAMVGAELVRVVYAPPTWT